eukprot:8362-Eustigmatos_ZCMA.PRE.1
MKGGGLRLCRRLNVTKASKTLRAIAVSALMSQQHGKATAVVGGGSSMGYFDPPGLTCTSALLAERLE